ncbi:MAG: hypothetical protein E3J72_03405 [Planctomycetota bacterium]|nr:MAG: hypothetical protein E3J72_03405 [Planctomycetota bacterium]
MGNNQTGEVSTRLIVALAVVGVLIIAAVPFGWYMWKPTVQFIEYSMGYGLEWEEDFEEFSRSEWRADERVKIVDAPERPGEKCAYINGSFDVVLSRPVTGKPPLEIEFDVRLKDDIIQEIYCFYSLFFRIRTRPEVCLLKLYTSGIAETGAQRGIEKDKTSIRKDIGFESGRWYHVKVLYEHVGENCRITTTVDKTLIGKKDLPLSKWQAIWEEANIGFVPGYGKSFIDNVSIRRIRK